MDKALLEATAAALVAPGKGILAADESNGTMSKRLEGVGLESSEEARRAYRANLFATPGCESAVSGVILFDETIRQNMDDGTPIPDYLNSRGILPGIKVDTGAKKYGATEIYSKLNNKNVRHVNFSEWSQIDDKEVELGEPKGKPREKYTYIEEMLSVIK